jgi:hypothetical protein
MRESVSDVEIFVPVVQAISQGVLSDLRVDANILSKNESRGIVWQQSNESRL